MAASKMPIVGMTAGVGVEVSGFEEEEERRAGTRGCGEKQAMRLAS